MNVHPNFSLNCFTKFFIHFSTKFIKLIISTNIKQNEKSQKTGAPNWSSNFTTELSILLLHTIFQHNFSAKFSNLISQPNLGHHFSHTISNNVLHPFLSRNFSNKLFLLIFQHNFPGKFSIKIVYLILNQVFQLILSTKSVGEEEKLLYMGDTEFFTMLTS